MPAATIYDVATRAGVSISTVSLALNAPKRVKGETLQRVLAAVDELGFVPRAEAAARARKGTGRIGVMAPFTTYPSFVQRLHGVIDALRGQPHELVIYDQESAAVRRSELASLPITRRLDGLIVMSVPFDEHIAQSLLRHGLETVLIELARPSFSSVEVDDVAGGQLAGDHLVARGHRRCAFLGEHQLSGYFVSQCERRLAGFRRSLADASIELPDDHVLHVPSDVAAARQGTHRLLDLAEPPTAVFAHSDILAIGVLRAARDRGLAVPGDLAVIGFDDLEVADHLGLTTIHQPLVQSGRIATEVLLARLADGARPPQRVTLPVHLVARDTT